MWHPQRVSDTYIHKGHQISASTKGIRYQVGWHGTSYTSTSYTSWIPGTCTWALHHINPTHTVILGTQTLCITYTPVYHPSEQATNRVIRSQVVGTSGLLAHLQWLTSSLQTTLLIYPRPANTHNTIGLRGTKMSQDPHNLQHSRWNEACIDKQTSDNRQAIGWLLSPRLSIPYVSAKPNDIASSYTYRDTTESDMPE